MGKKKKPQGSAGSSQREGFPEQPENATFQAACAKIQENTQRHLERMRSIVGDTDEQEEVTVEEESILTKLSEGFTGSKQETQDILGNLLSGGYSAHEERRAQECPWNKFWK